MVKKDLIAIEGKIAIAWSKGLKAASWFFPCVEEDFQSLSSSVIVSDHIETLEKAKSRCPESLRVWLIDDSSQVTIARIREGVERAQVAEVIRTTDVESLAQKVLERAVERSHGERRRRQLFSELRLKNQQMEELTSGLETSVIERTKVAAESKIQVEAKLTKINELIQFVKDLTFQREVEDLLLLLRKESRLFHGALDPVLVCTIPSKGPVILYLRAGVIIERQTRGGFLGGSKFRSHQQSDSQFLANELGRPFGRVIFFPLPTARGGIFFEHSMDPETQARFVTWVQERLQAVGLALDRILYESELKFASSLWEQTFDGIEEPVAVVDQNFQLLRANKNFSSDLILGRCFEHFAKRVESCQGCPLPRSVVGQDSFAGQVRRDHKTFEVHSYPIRLEEGDPHASTFVNHYVDVTKSKMLQGQLVQAEKLAALGQLAGHIAHELNNPLSGIRSLAQILLKTLPQETTLAGDLSEVEKAATRCQKIIENLLEFSRDQDASEVAPVDLNDVLKKTLPLLKTAMGALTSEIEMTDNPVFVRASSQLLQQVVFNLVINACQAMGEKGHLLLRVSAADGWGEFMVQDSGLGIPVEIQERIFEPFFTTKESGLGTGLGLSMCREIVESFRGKISFENNPEGGARFFVRLPCEGTP